MISCQNVCKKCFYYLQQSNCRHDCNYLTAKDDWRLLIKVTGLFADKSFYKRKLEAKVMIIKSLLTNILTPAIVVAHITIICTLLYYCLYRPSTCCCPIIRLLWSRAQRMRIM